MIEVKAQSRNAKILLLKVPTIPVPEDISDVSSPAEDENDFKKRIITDFYPSLALSTLKSFVHKYFNYSYDMNVYDMNLDAYNNRNHNNLLDYSFLDYAKNQIKCYDFNVIAISCQFQTNQGWVDIVSEWVNEIEDDIKIIVFENSMCV